MSAERVSDVASVTARAVSAVTAVNTAVDAAGSVKLSLTPTRSTPSDKLVVGSRRKATGKVYSTGSGEEVLTSIHGQIIVVRRIIDRARPCPVCVADTGGTVLGWMPESSLQEVEG